MAVVATSLLLAACGAGDDDPDHATVTVFAAASLTDAMTDLASAFELESGGDIDVDLVFGPSSGLREQVLAGAPADVFASADAANLEHLVAASEVDDGRVFARNRVQIAVPPGNPAGVGGLADFARPELFIGLCARDVPCGVVGRRALQWAGVEPAPDTEATDVRAVLTQVASGDLDAGLVYETDVEAAEGAVEGIDVPAGADARTEYLIGTVVRRGNADRAEDFVSFVVSDAGRAILTSHGFGAP